MSVEYSKCCGERMYTIFYNVCTVKKTNYVIMNNINRIYNMLYVNESDNTCKGKGEGAHATEWGVVIVQRRICSVALPQLPSQPQPSRILS